MKTSGLARLRNRQFFSIEALNVAIAELLDDLNARIMRRVGRSRKDLFLEIERPALRPLPDTPFEYAEWKQAKVNPDYHIAVLHSFYSVPHRLIGRHVDVRLTHRMIEIFYNHERVVVHHRRGAYHGAYHGVYLNQGLFRFASGGSSKSPTSRLGASSPALSRIG